MACSHHALTTVHKPIVAALDYPGQHTTMTVDTPARSSLYLWYLILIATVGPLQFGYHLVGFLNSVKHVRLIRFLAVRIECSQ
jgi:hypothetical protein